MRVHVGLVGGVHRLRQVGQVVQREAERVPRSRLVPGVVEVERPGGLGAAARERRRGGLAVVVLAAVGVVEVRVVHRPQAEGVWVVPRRLEVGVEQSLAEVVVEPVVADPPGERLYERSDPRAVRSRLLLGELGRPVDDPEVCAVGLVERVLAIPAKPGGGRRPRAALAVRSSAAERVRLAALVDPPDIRRAASGDLLEARPAREPGRVAARVEVQVAARVGRPQRPVAARRQVGHRRTRPGQGVPRVRAELRHVSGAVEPEHELRGADRDLRERPRHLRPTARAVAEHLAVRADAPHRAIHGGADVRQAAGDLHGVPLLALRAKDLLGAREVPDVGRVARAHAGCRRRGGEELPALVCAVVPDGVVGVDGPRLRRAPDRERRDAGARGRHRLPHVAVVRIQLACGVLRQHCGVVAGRDRAERRWRGHLRPALASVPLVEVALAIDRPQPARLGTADPCHGLGRGDLRPPAVGKLVDRACVVQGKHRSVGTGAELHGGESLVRCPARAIERHRCPVGGGAPNALRVPDRNPRRWGRRRGRDRLPASAHQLDHFAAAGQPEHAAVGGRGDALELARLGDPSLRSHSLAVQRAARVDGEHGAVGGGADAHQRRRNEARVEGESGGTEVRRGHGASSRAGPRSSGLQRNRGRACAPRPSLLQLTGKWRGQRTDLLVHGALADLDRVLGAVPVAVP